MILWLYVPNSHYLFHFRKDANDPFSVIGHSLPKKKTFSAGISDANLNVIQNDQVQKIEAEANALEKKVVKLERLVQILDERAGPARVDSDSSESDF